MRYCPLLFPYLHLPRLKKLIAIVLLLAVLSQGLVNLLLCAYYEVNKKMITEKLCVNKNNPSMHCNGHCYLTKQLKKAEENEKRQSQSLREKDDFISYYHGLQLLTYIPYYRFSGLLRFGSFNLVSAGPSALFQPPQSLA